MPYKKDRLPVPNSKDMLRWDSKKAKPIRQKLWKQIVDGVINPKSCKAIDVYLSDSQCNKHFRCETFRPHLRDFANEIIELKEERGTGTSTRGFLFICLFVCF